MPRDFPVADVAGGGVVDDARRHLFDLGAQLTRRAVLVHPDELVARNEEHFLFESGHVLPPTAANTTITY